MSRESKFVLVNNNLNQTQATATRLESFGWETQSLSGNVLLLSRETQDPVYPELVAYEKEYEKKSAALSHLHEPQPPAAPAPLRIGVLIITLLLFILPGVLYILYHQTLKKKHAEAVKVYEAAYEAYQTENHALLNELSHIIQASRTLFFSPRA